MTVLNVDTDKLLEIAVIVTEGDTLATVDQWEASIAPRDLNPDQSQESIVIHCDDRSLDTMNEWCVKQHGATGLTQRCRESNILCQVRLGLEVSYLWKLWNIILINRKSRHNKLLVSSGRGEDGAGDVEQAHGEGEKPIGGEHGECWPMRGQDCEM